MTYEEYHSTPHIIETDRLTLRRLSMADDVAMFDYASNPEVTRHVSFPTHRSIEDSRAFLKIVMAQYEQNEPSVYGIILRETGNLIGTIGLLNWSRVHFRTEIGYALGQPYWNQGIVSEATRALIDHLFTHIDLVRIEAQCKLENIGSAKVMEKVGMTFEGVLRKHICMKGVHEDVKIYSIVRNEWNNKNR